MRLSINRAETQSRGELLLRTFFGGIYIFLTMFLTSLGFELSYKQLNTIHNYIFVADFLVFVIILNKVN